MTRMRPSLSYANVVATLALFVALGGSAAAVVTITGKDIKNRSIKRIDVKRNTLTGGEIREGRLGKVPTALRADQATTAQTAANASQLGGLGGSAFARASQIDSGSGDNAATAQTALISFPEAGVEVRTDGDADMSNALRLVNTRATGIYHYWTTGNPNAVGTLPPSANVEIAGPVGAPLNHEVVLALQSSPPGFAPSPVVSITCRFNIPPTVACIGIQSR